MKWKIGLIFALVVCLAVPAGRAAVQVAADRQQNVCQTALSDAVLRLHVRADNNSEEAQAVKLSVRDALLDVMEKYEDEMTDKKSAASAVMMHRQEILRAAMSVLRAYGCTYGVDIKLERLQFPEKYYGDVCFPEGMYDAVVVRLGSGAGENWWCVLFPKLCFVTAEDGRLPEDSKKMLKEALPGKDGTDTADGTLRFKIVEWLDKIW